MPSEVKVSLADYGVGNLHSIKKALEISGADVTIVENMGLLENAECIVFPGVGAFDKTMERLLPHKEKIKEMLENGIPALGICIGMHILFEGSEEGSSEGIGFFKGSVKKLEAKRIPHMGWNSVDSGDPILEGIENRKFYFAHSYYAKPEENVSIGKTEYEGISIDTLFKKENVYGCQFHPEKSSSSGLKMIADFLDFVGGLK
jgi:glutamine amidotransferase